MKKVQIHQFDPIIYPVKLWIVTHPILDEIKKNFVEHDEAPLSIGAKSSGVAQTYSKIVINNNTNKYGILIVLYSKISVGQIAHEATHAARVVWDWLGEYSTGIEADAYLVGWVADCIDQVKTNKFK